MIQRLLPLILLICFAHSLSADAESLVNDFRDAMYLQQIDDDALFQMYSSTLTDLADLNLGERDLTFWKAQAAYYMARGYQAPATVDVVIAQDKNLRTGKFKQMQKSYDNLDKIVSFYEDSLSLSGDYLEGGRDARGVRLYAEALSQLSTLKSLGYLMSHGPKVQPLAEEAIELDPGEIKAHLLLASRYVYSPGVWGGDPDKGIAMLEDIGRMTGLSREDEFNINIGIGFAHTMAGRWDEAVSFFQKAHEIYPGNVFAAGMIELSEAGGIKES